MVEELHDATLLQADRPLELRRQHTDLVALAQDAVRRCAQASETHQIHCRSAEPLLVGNWDADRLRRVVANLLSNALKYSPHGGETVVDVQREQDTAVLAVSDQGIGIPAHDLPHVFERYQWASNVVGRISGSGLGLAGAKDIVEQHGGTIGVASAEGDGTTFSIRLPLADDGLTAAGQPSLSEGLSTIR